MASGSLKDLIKALSTTFSAPSSPKPSGGIYKSKDLPPEIQQAIQTYLDKHASVDESDSQRLHEELLTVYNKQVQHDNAKLASFLHALRLLQPLLRGQARLEEWWKTVIEPVVNGSGHKRVEVDHATEFLLAILDYDADTDTEGEKAKNSGSFVRALLDAYVKRTRVHAPDAEALTLKDDFVARQLENVLVGFGRKKPKDFMQAIDRLVVDRKHRMQALGLLSAFARHQPPHLYLVSQTSLIEHLLKCLMIDTSSTVISLALACLIMFLPHIPSSVKEHLPRLFLIYSRILCWERFFPSGPEPDKAEATKESAGPTDESEARQDPAADDEEWEKLHSSFDNAESTAPELIHYFTFLYGLYPLNFTSYIRKPRRYLKDIKFPRAEDFDLDQAIIRTRTEQFRRVHLMHPNFYTKTAEDELADNRWLKSDPADVVLECMNLCIAASEPAQESAPQPIAEVPPHYLHTDDIPHQSLLSKPDDHHAVLSKPIEDVRSEIFASPTGSARPGPSISHPFHGTPSTQSPTASSPVARPLDDASDSPTLPAVKFPPTIYHDSSSNRQGSISSFPSNSNQSPRAGPVSRSQMPRSPAIRPVPQGEANMAFLQREVMLLRNDLNFERYLKEQHLSHIGQLQRRHIKEATVEAETQNLISTNRVLKAKLAKANDSYASLKKETATGRNQSKKWEAELSTRVKSLRDDERQWRAEEEALRLELAHATKDCDHLRQLVMDSESKELLARQELTFADIKLEQLDDLKARIHELEEKLRGYEAKDLIYAQGSDEKASLKQELAAANLMIQSRDASHERAREQFDRRVRDLETELLQAQNPTAGYSSGQVAPYVQALIDSAVATVDAKYTALEKKHATLEYRYVELEMRCQELEDTAEGTGRADSPRTPQARNFSGLVMTDIDAHTHDAPSSAPFATSATQPGTTMGSTSLPTLLNQLNRSFQPPLNNPPSHPATSQHLDDVFTSSSAPGKMMLQRPPPAPPGTAGLAQYFPPTSTSGTSPVAPSATSSSVRDRADSDLSAGGVSLGGLQAGGDWGFGLGAPGSEAGSISAWSSSSRESAADRTKVGVRGEIRVTGRGSAQNMGKTATKEDEDKKNASGKKFGGGIMGIRGIL